MSPHGVERGMKVRDIHGALLGKVARRGERTFLVEKGWPFKKRFQVRYEDVTRVDDGVLWVNETGAQLEAEAYATPLHREHRSPTRSAMH
ncbi:MAG TPA: hypothetical protein VIL20_01320 [Sandaracinaceae bacterium]